VEDDSRRMRALGNVLLRAGALSASQRPTRLKPSGPVRLEQSVRPAQPTRTLNLPATSGRKRQPRSFGTTTRRGIVKAPGLALKR